MQLRHFVLPVKDFAASEMEMNAFLRSHRVLTVNREFVADGENSFWCFNIEYLDGPKGAVNRSGGKAPKVDYREILEPKEFEVFSRLRDWRKSMAEKEGIPVYSVMTNEQLAQVIKRKIGSKTALKEIEGIGEARVEKYGEGLLAQLNSNPVPG